MFSVFTVSYLAWGAILRACSNSGTIYGSSIAWRALAEHRSTVVPGKSLYPPWKTAMQYHTQQDQQSILMRACTLTRMSHCPSQPKTIQINLSAQNKPPKPPKLTHAQSTSASISLPSTVLCPGLDPLPPSSPLSPPS